MKTKRTIQKAKAGKKRTKKSEASLFLEVEGFPYTGVPNPFVWSLRSGNWNESRRNEKTWDVLFEALATKPFEGENELPVGSEYHSYIIAHHTMVKTRKNTWKIKMEGKKFKLAHKVPGSKLNTTNASRKKYLIKFLKDTLLELELGHGRAPSQSKLGSKAGSSKTSKTLI